MTPSAPAGAVLKRILVATDYSPAAHRAVWQAGRLARQHNAHLYLVHAQPDWNLFSQTSSCTADQFKAVTAHAENALRAEVAWLEATFGIHARGENRIGRASEVLRSVVRTIEPHVIVAGARGEHESPEMAPLLGGTALKLIAFAPVPILLVRRDSLPYRTALAAIESQREGAHRLIRWAHTLVGEGDCHVVHAFEVPYAQRLRAHGVADARMEQSREEARQATRAVIEELVRSSAPGGLRLHAHLICGEPVGAVLGEIEARKPDVVILGKHQHPPREAHLAAFGSVALRVAYHAPGDVLIVP